ncbi:MAG: efflux RND transporter permease subunit [Fuerstiella sp.]|nr:efflux RND transporter permease subunit [Fuerstiella sp.]
MSLPSFSVRNSVLVNMLMLVLLASGFIMAFTLQREMFPESRPDKLLISAVYPGVQPEDVEKAVTIKIEESVRSLEGIEKIEAQVGEGVSFVTLTVSQSVRNVDVLMQEVRNELDAIQDLPDDVEEIRLSKVEPQLPVIAISVFGDGDERSMKRAANQLRDDLLGLPGVSKVQLNGIREDEIYVDVLPDQLLKYDVTFEEIALAIRRANLDISGGRLKGNRSTVAVRTMGEQQSAAGLEDIVIRAETGGRRIQLKDVAELSDAFVDTDLRLEFKGQQAVDVVVFSGQTEDVVEIAAVIKTWFAARNGDSYTGPSLRLCQALSMLGRANLYEIDQQSRSNPFTDEFKYQLHTDIARFVEGRLDLMLRNGRVGLILVLISLNIFLNWRVAWWAAVGLVVSFTGTFAAMFVFGASINLLSMFAMIIVLGIIVDDAIVIGENIYRHVEEGVPPERAAVLGAEEVMWPVIVAVATTIGAFAPLFFIRGQVGDFMAQLPLVVIAALVVSLIEALVILPAHLKHLPASASSQGATAADTAVAGLKNRIMRSWVHGPYESVLRTCLKWRYVTVATSMGACILAGGLLAGGIVKWAFIQEMDSESLICALEMPIGTTSDRVQRELGRLSDFIGADKGLKEEVLNVRTTAGRQYDMTGAGSVGFDDQSHLGQLVIELKPADKRARSSTEILASLRKFCEEQLRGINSVRWEAMNGGPGGRDIQISLSGLSDDRLPGATHDLKRMIAEIEGVYDLDDDFDLGRRELRLKLLDSATPTGVTVGSLGLHVRGALYGQEARRITRNREDVRIMVRYPQEYRTNTWNVEKMWLPGPGLPGQRNWMPMDEIAAAEMGVGYSTITRYQQTRSATITASVDDAVVPGTSTVQKAIQDLVSSRLLPVYPGLKVEFLGEAEEMRKSFGSLRMAFPVALLIIYGMLAGLFKSYTQPLVVMSAIPFGFLGAVVGHWVTGETFTIMSSIGLVALAGILVNDSLVLVDFVNRRMAAGLSALEASVDGARKRLRAILLTTLTTASGLVPLMFEKSFQAKFLIPMAVTLTFGLIFATALTLILVPCLNLIRDDLITQSVQLRIVRGRVLRFFGLGRPDHNAVDDDHASLPSESERTITPM